MKSQPTQSLNDVTLAFGIKHSLVFFLRHLFPYSAGIQTLEKNLVEREIQKMKTRSTGKIIAVDRRENLSEKDFIQEYFSRSRPVVFSREAKNWPCTRKWNFDFLENELEGVYFNLSDNSGLVEKEYEHAPKQTQATISAKDLSRSVKQGDKWYLRFSTMLDRNKNLLGDLDQAWLKKMRRCFMGVCYQNFIGAQGRKTPIHSESTALFYVMVHGRKKWTMASAKSTALVYPKRIERSYFSSDVDLTDRESKTYPGLAQIPIYQCDLEEGDVLFVPAWMWHQVENLSDSWGLSYSFTSIQSFMKHPMLALVRVVFGKPSFIKTLLSGFFPSLHVNEEAPQIIRD